MKVNVYNLKGGIKGQIEIPQIFEYPYRPDLIKKCIHAIQSNRRQPYGSSPLAGLRRVGHNWGPNHGRSRIPRVADRDRGVLLPYVVGGRAAHPPKVEKNWTKKINKKEMHLAKYSALSQSINKEFVKHRGHRFNEEITFPIVVDDTLETVSKAKQAMEIFKNLGLFEDLERAKKGIKIRAGKGKMRGRKYRVPKSVLLVVKDKTYVRKGFGNFPGVDILTPAQLNVEALAPGGVAGRLTVYTESAIAEIKRWAQ